MTYYDPRSRSRAMLEGSHRAGARAMLRAFGLKDEDFAKPQIGVGATWNRVTPCNAGLDVLRRAAARRLTQSGATAYEFDTISISDGISMGSEGMRASLVSRDWIAGFGGARRASPGLRWSARHCGMRQIHSRHAHGHGAPGYPRRVRVWRLLGTGSRQRPRYLAAGCVRGHWRECTRPHEC